MSDITKTGDDTTQPEEQDKVEQILERAAADPTFRDQLVNDFDNVAQQYNLTPEDLEGLNEAYEGFVEAGQIEVLDGRDNPLSLCCCCSPCSCCCA